jgi:uncharacterized protein
MLRMKIWIDLANSPQVLFFRPIIPELKRRGHEVVITSRDFAQTVALADRHQLCHTQVGSHDGGHWFNTTRRILRRALNLRHWVKSLGGIDLAVSHNSYSQGIAAKMLGLPFITLMDYEHQPLNHLCFRLAHRVIVPQVFPDSFLTRFGATGKTTKYPCLKEEVYLEDFVATPGYLQDLGVAEDKVSVVLRPPAPWTPYHPGESRLFDEVLSWVANNEQAFIFFLPRVTAQKETVRTCGYQNLWIPPRALDGPNLLYHADLVISGGGTMNREAAVLDTPTYTVFQGELGAVDRYLISKGLMIQITNIADIGKICIKKRPGRGPVKNNGNMVKEITNLILEKI